MKRLAAAFCALALTAAASGAALADCSPGHSASAPVQTDTKGS